MRTHLQSGFSVCTHPGTCRKMWENMRPHTDNIKENRENGPKKYTFDMNPDVNLTWNDVFFLALWNENQQTEGGPRFFSSSYFRINASDPSSPSPGGGNNNNPKNSASGLSRATKIGIGVGVGVGVPALILVGAAVFYLRRRSKTTAAQTRQGAEYSAGAGAGIGGYSSQHPPVSEVSGDAAYKAELPDESTAPCRAELPGRLTTPSKQTEPSEVDPTNVGVGVQSRFIELPGN